MTTPGICPKHPKQRISKETTPKTGDKPNAPCSKHTKPEHRPGSGGFFSSLLERLDDLRPPAAEPVLEHLHDRRHDERK